ncbi:MAG: 5-(carboxyamino)imidazole ribonucleotide synthase [Spirochaetia bacterium]|nr:5-(carboxyamino)imidazole ribonucleotide synthase [Spirochaetia bacterium]
MTNARIKPDAGNPLIGVLGGGQLGRFLVNTAREWDIRLSILDPDPEAPAGRVAHRFQVGNLLDYETVIEFARDLDILTVEIENVNADALEAIEARIPVRPSSQILRMVQDKGLQKEFYRKNGIPTSEFLLIAGKLELPESPERYPAILKLRRGGYDGRGVTRINSPAECPNGFDMPSVLEELVPIEKEISVIVSRNSKGQTAAYPSVEMVFNSDHVLDYQVAPADVSVEVEAESKRIALDLAEILKLEGILAVEMFITKSGKILVNEIAPRPHNSGHSTIEGNRTSQYEQHLRMLLGYPPGPTDLIQPHGLLNVLGSGAGEPVVHGMPEALAIPGVHVHLYGKAMSKQGRKMGHVTVLADDRAILLDRLNQLRTLRVGPV